MRYASLLVLLLLPACHPQPHYAFTEGPLRLILRADRVASTEMPLQIHILVAGGLPGEPIVFIIQTNGELVASHTGLLDVRELTTFLNFTPAWWTETYCRKYDETIRGRQMGGSRDLDASLAGNDFDPAWDGETDIAVTIADPRTRVALARASFRVRVDCPSCVGVRCGRSW